jgi:hypothetical protein
MVGYTHMRGVGQLPIAGGLFIGDEISAALASTGEFPVTQDQRHTLRGRANYQLAPRASIALAVSYGSGLPVEFTGDREDAIAQYGERIVDRVDVECGRVRPSISVDASLSATLLKTAARSLRVQADALNLTNRLNVINFAGLFSGTALAPPRSVAVRLRAEFLAPFCATSRSGATSIPRPRWPGSPADPRGSTPENRRAPLRPARVPRR